MDSSYDESSNRTLGQDIGTGLIYAVGFSILAVVILAGAAIADVFGAIQLNDWSELPTGLPVVFLGYGLAGVLGGAAFWVLRPLRRWLVGWMLTGFVLVALVYGAVGLTGVLGYYAGVNLLDLESAAEGWESLPIVAIGLGVLGGIPIGIYYWYKERKA